MHFFLAEAELRTLENSAQIFNALSDIPGGVDDVDCLFKVSSAQRELILNLITMHLVLCFTIVL